jgi:hypothetical protein
MFEQSVLVSLGSSLDADLAVFPGYLSVHHRLCSAALGIMDRLRQLISLSRWNYSWEVHFLVGKTGLAT